MTTRLRDGTAAHRLHKRRLYKELTAVENGLGTGVGPHCALSLIPDGATRDARRTILEAQRVLVEKQLDAIKAAEDRRWLLDRAYGADVADETCSRAMFSKQREVSKVDSHISKISVPPAPKTPSSTPTTHYYKQRQFNTAADRFYGSVAGGLFNLDHTTDLTATAAMHEALLADGKTLPDGQGDRLTSVNSLINRLSVKRAIAGLSLGAVAGVDGFPAEFFKQALCH